MGLCGRRSRGAFIGVVEGNEICWGLMCEIKGEWVS